MINNSNKIYQLAKTQLIQSQGQLELQYEVCHNYIRIRNDKRLHMK